MNVSSLSAVLFDLDGTLIEFPISFFLSEAERIIDVLEHPAVSREILSHHFSSFDFFAFVEEGNRETFTERFWSHFDWESFPKPTPFAGIVDALTDLRALGFRTAIATARHAPPDKLRIELDPSGLSAHFDVIATHADRSVSWMDKSGQILEICRTLEIRPEEAVLIGDVPADIVSAHAAGLGGAIAVRSGGIREEVLRAANPSVIVESVVEAVQYLRNLRRENGI